MILAKGTGVGVQSEGSTPLCLVLVTSLRLMFHVCLFLGPHTHTFFVCGKASSRPGGTDCEWLGLLWRSHTTLVYTQCLKVE